MDLGFDVVSCTLKLPYINFDNIITRSTCNKRFQFLCNSCDCYILWNQSKEWLFKRKCYFFRLPSSRSIAAPTRL
uniref:Uncharacterized protein n=1 Tax=Arundo donax TaxID=35708 RepID=A0A0A9IL83_ARUDO